MKKNNWEQSACTRFKDIYRWIVVLATNSVAFKFLELLKYHRCKVTGFAGSCSRICWLVLPESVGSFPINMLHQEVKTENVAFLALSAPSFLNICFTQQILDTIRQKKLLLRVNKFLKLYRFITFFPTLISWSWSFWSSWEHLSWVLSGWISFSLSAMVGVQLAFMHQGKEKLTLGKTFLDQTVVYFLFLLFVTTCFVA